MQAQMKRYEESKEARTLKASYMPLFLTQCTTVGMNTPKHRDMFCTILLGRKVEGWYGLSSADAAQVVRALDTDRGALVAVLVITYHSEKWSAEFLAALLSKHVGKKKVAECSDEELLHLLQQTGALPAGAEGVAS